MDKALQTMIANLEKKTGKSLSDWVGVVKSSKLSKHGEIVKFLKTEHGFTHGFANLVAHEARGSAAANLAETTDLVAEQYKGKDNLRPIYDKLMKEVQKFGKDLEIAPKKAYVSLRRSKQFAILQPSTKTRLDVGLNLKEVEPQGKLEAAGSWNSMCSHRIRITDIGEADAEVVKWLKMAYENA